MAVENPVYPTLNPDLIPEYTQYSIAKTFGKNIIRYFQDRPEVFDEIEARRVEREAMLAAEQISEE